MYGDECSMAEQYIDSRWMHIGIGITGHLNTTLRKGTGRYGNNGLRVSAGIELRYYSRPLANGLARKRIGKHNGIA
jgi:hypothetical protein